MKLQRRALRGGSCFAAILVAPLFVAAQAATPEMLLRDGNRQLEEGRTLLTVPTLSGARSSFESCLRIDAKSAACAYGLARTAHYLDQSAEYAHDSGAAKHWLDVAIEDAQKAVALDDRSADAHALLADLYGAKISGPISGMRYGPKANAECARALQLDPRDAQAFAVTGRKYLYAPTMFGGDIDKAIASFKRATALDPLSDEYFAWLAIAYRKKGDAADAQQALKQALRINSRSVFAQHVQSGVE